MSADLRFKSQIEGNPSILKPKRGCLENIDRYRGFGVLVDPERCAFVSFRVCMPCQQHEGLSRSCNSFRERVEVSSRLCLADPCAILAPFCKNT